MKSIINWKNIIFIASSAALFTGCNGTGTTSVSVGYGVYGGYGYPSYGYGGGYYGRPGYRPPPPSHRPKPGHPISKPGRPSTMPSRPTTRPSMGRPASRPSGGMRRR